MRKLILLITIVMLGIWGISNADFSKTYPQHGGSGSGDVTSSQMVSAIHDSLDSLRAKSRFDSLFALYFESLMAIHWEGITKNAAFDSTENAPNSDSLKAKTLTDITLPPSYASHWLIHSIAAADSDSTILADSGFPVTLNPDSASVWAKPTSTTDISLVVQFMNNAGTLIGNHRIILTSTNWTEYRFAFRTGVALTQNTKYTCGYRVVMTPTDSLLISNLELW